MKTRKILCLLLTLFLLAGMLLACDGAGESSSSSSSDPGTSEPGSSEPGSSEPSEPTPDADTIWRIEDVPTATNPWERFKDHQKLSIYGDEDIPNFDEDTDFVPYVIPYLARGKNTAVLIFADVGLKSDSLNSVTVAPPRSGASDEVRSHPICAIKLKHIVFISSSRIMGNIFITFSMLSSR